MLLLGIGSSVAAQNCPPLDPSRRLALINYVRKEYKLDKSLNLALTNERFIGTDCYRELTFEGRGWAGTWRLKLFLSPDQRYLSDQLLDTASDPEQEERRKNEILMAGLSQNKGSSKGREDASVTIVEFSDFECPYCRQLAELIDELPQVRMDEIRIVFHHLPLSMHRWARAAAEAAACAQLQSSEAFWAIHDQIFPHQDGISADNFQSKIMEFARLTNALDRSAFRSCLENQMSLGLVFRDINLASANNITATPTLFINGRRVSGVKDATELRELIRAAENQTP